jgi:hypothetical protein
MRVVCGGLVRVGTAYQIALIHVLCAGYFFKKEDKKWGINLKSFGGYTGEK